MQEREIAITGSKGVIGSVLIKGLLEYKITPIDLPNEDVRNYDRLLQLFPGHEAIIHLAWDTKTDNFKSETINPDNSLMFNNVYKAALESGVRRVIMASSVHADSFYKSNNDLFRTNTLPVPDSPYGAHKVFMERLGKWYSGKGLEVVCIRFGGVNLQNEPPKTTDNATQDEISEKNVWLSHKDCVELVKDCIDAREIPDNFTIIYGVSNNKGLKHDISNPFGWLPQNNAEKV